MIRVGVILGYRIAYNYIKQLEAWEKGEAHEKLPYGYYRIDEAEAVIKYASFSKLERKLLPCSFLQKLYMYLVKFPVMLATCDVIWTQFDKDALFAALLRRIPLLNKLFAIQISNFIWLIDNSRQYSRTKIKLISWLLGKIDRVVSFSCELNKFIEVFGCDEKKLKYIPFGINLDAYSRELTSRIPAGAISVTRGFILSVGTDMHRDMGMLRRLTKALPGYEFVLATSNKDFLNALYETNTFALKASLPEMRWLYCNCTCVIIPLKYNEHVSGCTTVLEAAAMRKPVVISDVPGIRNYVLDGVTGIIVPVNDAEAFRNAIIKLGNDPEYSRIMGENAYNFVKGRFTSENFARAHLELTKEILMGGAGHEGRN